MGESPGRIRMGRGPCSGLSGSWQGLRPDQRGCLQWDPAVRPPWIMLCHPQALGWSSGSVAAHLTWLEQVTFLCQEMSACLSAWAQIKNLLSAISVPHALAPGSLSPTPEPGQWLEKTCCTHVFEGDIIGSLAGPWLHYSFRASATDFTRLPLFKQIWIQVLRVHSPHFAATVIHLLSSNIQYHS